MVELVKATKTHPELVSTIGLCNFDAEHTEEACKYVLEKTGEVGIVSNQVQVSLLSCAEVERASMLTQCPQFSLIDSRPLQKMSAVCEKYGVKLLTYGSFVSEAVGRSSVSRRARTKLTEILSVRRFHLTKMARAADPRDLLGSQPTHSVSTQGKSKDSASRMA